MTEEKKYKNKVLFLRKSKGGEHLYAFSQDNSLGEDVASLILNISELIPVIEGKRDWVKVSLIPPKEKENDV